MKKHIPNFLTSLNLVTGAIGCFYLIEQDHHRAIYFVILAAFFDFLDGFIARLLKVQSGIGKELDSLADVVSFGLLPAVYMVMSIRQQTDHQFLPYFGLLIAALSAIRLAKFNLDTRQTDQFIGLPTPANAIMITSLSFLPGSFSLGVPALLIITLITSLILVANLPLIALKFIGFSWVSNQWKYLLIIAIVILVSIFREKALPLIIPVYLLISVLNIVLRTGKR